MRFHKNRSGLSLVEVMVASALFAMLIIAFVTMTTQQQRQTQKLEYADRAQQILYQTAHGLLKSNLLNESANWQNTTQSPVTDFNPMLKDCLTISNAKTCEDPGPDENNWYPLHLGFPPSSGADWERVSGTDSEGYRALFSVRGNACGGKKGALKPNCPFQVQTWIRPICYKEDRCDQARTFSVKIKLTEKLPQDPNGKEESKVVNLELLAVSGNAGADL